MSTRKLHKTIAAVVTEVVATVVVLATALGAAAWILAIVFPAAGPVGAALIAFFAAVGIEGIASMIGDWVVGVVARRGKRTEVAA